MISAKHFALLTTISLAKDTGQLLNLITAYGFISGKIDNEMLDAMDNASKVIQTDNPDSIELINEFDVIALKDVTVRPSGNFQSKITMNTLTVFSDQVIAACVGEEIQS